MCFSSSGPTLAARCEGEVDNPPASLAVAVLMVRFLLRDAVVLTVSLRQPPPKSPGMARWRFDRGLLFDAQILQGGDRGHDDAAADLPPRGQEPAAVDGSDAEHHQARQFLREPRRVFEGFDAQGCGKGV